MVMSKRMTVLVAGLVLYALSGSMAWAVILIDGGSEACTDLLAGSASTDVGDVCLSTDGTDNFFVKYTTAGVWKMESVASWLGDDLTDLPMDNDIPTPGKFPYFQDLTNGAGADMHIFTIPFMDVD